jgi:outer membrane receptor protein involved in Fe transport
MTGKRGGGVVVVAMVCMAGACARQTAPATTGLPGAAAWTESVTQRSARAAQGGTVLSSAQLGSGSDVLDALESRIATMRVDRANSRCPRISLRGVRSLLGSTDPTVYVNGTRMANTCVLNSIRPADVRRVEVYPGVTGRPEYRPSPNGMVLIFLVGWQGN